MERKQLTTNGIAGLKPLTKRHMVGDTIAPALSLQIGTSGVKSFLWVGRLDGKPKWVTLGRWPAMSLDEARKAANEITRHQLAGVNIIAERAAKQQAVDKLAERTVDWLFELYMTAEGDAQKWGHAKRAIYNRDVKGAIGSMAIHAVDHDDLHRILSDKAKTAPTGSNQIQKLLSRLFGWAVREGRTDSGLKINPAADLTKLTKQTAKTRFLNDTEITYLLGAVQGWDSQVASMIELYLYTGARRDELRQMHWAEVDLDKALWTLPEARSKNGVEMVLPLMPRAIELLKGIKRHTTSPLVWWSHRTPENPYSGMSKSLSQLRTRMDRLAAIDGVSIPPYTIHDLRRTVATGLSDLVDADGAPIVTPHITHEILNHATGEARKGIGGVYNHAKYMAPKRAALTHWAAHLETLRPKVVAGL